MAQTIEAGKVLDLLNAFWRKLLDSDNRIDKHEEFQPVFDDEGKQVGHMFVFTLKNGHKVVKKQISTDIDNIEEGNITDPPCDVYYKSDTGKTGAYENLTSQKEIHDSMIEFLDELAEEEDWNFEEDNQSTSQSTVDKFGGMDKLLNSSTSLTSKKLQVELSKISQTQEISIGKVYCSYDPVVAYEDLELALSDKDFEASLTDTPQAFEIVSQDDDIIVDEIAEISITSGVEEILKAQFKALFLLYAKVNTISLFEPNPLSYTNTISWQIEWLLRSKLTKDVNLFNVFQSMSWDDVTTDLEVEQILENYAVTLDLYYSNFPHEVQKLLDEWLLTLRYNR